MAQLQNFQGMQYAREGGTNRDEKDYQIFREQYATSSLEHPEDMKPALIVQPKGDEDVIAAIKYAKDNGLALAIKSGGHQYSGASSTGGKNIQIDMGQAYQDLRILPTSDDNKDKVWVLAGVGNRLKDFNAYLRAQGLFVPHGQCAFVCVGGHGQTGGVGQLGRCFGLFGDHIRGIRLFDSEGVEKNITKQSDPELFYAITGGSPGNFGVITHYTIEVYQDEDYLGTSGTSGTTRADIGDNWGGPRGVKALWFYHPDTLKKLLNFVTDMADDPEFARNFDICVSMLSRDFPLGNLFASIDNSVVMDLVKFVLKFNPDGDAILDLLEGRTPPAIILYAQWCPTSKSDKYSEKVDGWFEQFRAMSSLREDWCLTFEELKQPMSAMSGNWIFPQEREYDLPYDKRAYATNSTTLGRDGWVSHVTASIDQIYNPKNGLEEASDEQKALYQALKLAVQIQHFGGNKSHFHLNANNGTSYSWRDSTVIAVLDCFYDPNVNGSRRLAQDWQSANDRMMFGMDSSFSPGHQKRLLWGSYGDWDLSKEEVWKTYHEDQAKIDRLGETRARADPYGMFTPNVFAVKAKGQ